MSQSGLDIDLGNLCSKDAYDWAKRTFVNRQSKPGEIAMDVDGAFSNLLIFGQERIGISSDGIGTKIELAERTGIYDTLGFDLVAMVADDLVTAGFDPVTISNIIDVDVLDREIINALMRGLADAANFAGMSISGGEIAELGSRISGFGSRMHFNWCSTAIGHLPAKLPAPLDGKAVQVGDVVIALRSRGFRSNGFSLIRRTLHKLYGEDWHLEPYNEEGKTWGQMLLTPSLIYTPLTRAWLEADCIYRAAAHITGGGILDNFQRVLKATKLGANLTNVFEPLPVMRRLIELGEIQLEAAYLYWNMGNGMLVVAPPDKVDEMLAIAKEKGYAAQVAGEIRPEPGISLQTAEVSLQYPPA